MNISVIVNGEKIQVKDDNLILNDKKIKDFDEILGLDTLVNINKLDLANNRITEIKGLDKLVNLKELYLNFNQITEIKGLDKLYNLKKLSLSYNRITEIKGLDTLVNLDDLYFINNRITEIKGLDKLRNLKIISLSYNQITKIKGLNLLVNLKELYLHRNQIMKIEGLNTLVNLNLLYLSYNQITEIQGLDTLRKLFFLRLDHNPLNTLDQMYYDSHYVKEIINYSIEKKKGKISYQIKPEDIKNYRNEEEAYNAFKEELKDLSTETIIKFGMRFEDHKLKIKQNYVFQKSKIEPIFLSETNHALKNIVIHMVQLHSLKGLDSSNDDKISQYLFFVKHFWSIDKINNHSVLLYDKHSRLRSIQKIEEFLTLSLKHGENFSKVLPNLIVFPENSIPYKMLEFLKKISEEYNIIIIGGLEHKEKNNEYINKAIIIDKGKMNEQIKQTPTWIFQNGSPIIKESISCRKIPRIQIFQTTLGKIAIFICKDFLRLADLSIIRWVQENNVDLIVIPSNSGAILPFHLQLNYIMNYSQYKNLKIIFTNVGEYGGSELYSYEKIRQIEGQYQKGIRDNIGEVIVIRKFKRQLEEDILKGEK